MIFAPYSVMININSNISIKLKTLNKKMMLKMIQHRIILRITKAMNSFNNNLRNNNLVTILTHKMNL